MKTLEQVKQHTIELINKVKGYSISGETKVFESPIQVSFVDKYKYKNTGFAYQIESMKHFGDKEPWVSVIIADCSGIISDGFINCLVPAESVLTKKQITELGF